MKKLLAFITSLILIITAYAVPVSAQEKSVLTINADDSRRKISDKLYGLFIEDISYACDGGLVSNLVNNGSFEYEFNKTTGWVSNNLTLSTDDKAVPMNKNNPTYATVTVNGKGALKNLGYTEMYDYKTYDRNDKKAETADMGFKEGVNYDFSCYLQNRDFNGTISIYLDSPKNKTNITTLDISTVGNNWTEINATLEAAATEDGGLAIEFDGSGTMLVDFVSLVPQESYGYGNQSWKYTTLRSDLYTALEQLNPSFIRFPGGCLAEGDSLENLYDWKETIGPLEERKQFYNLWRDDVGRDYINTMAMGYHEYFQLCDDLSAEPLPILNVGLTCQPRAAYDDYVLALDKLSMTDSQWESYLTEKRNLDPEKQADERKEFTDYINGLNINSRDDFEKYLDTIALRPGTAEWDAYVQDILDLIEYANGDAATSYWGALRAANGSEEPFNLKYIGLGNENWGEIYERNFRELYKAVKAVYPDITIISSSGTWLEGEAFDNCWDWIDKDFRDTIVDEHYYTNDSYLINNNNRYDSYDRNSAHVFVGEYAATSPGFGTIQTKSNIYEAVEEASYLTGIERNGDIVDMASYAPTFAKVNAQCWNVNLIWFDSQETVLTPSYYTQMLFANNYGSEYIASTFANGETDENGVYQSVTVDEKNQVMYVKLVNTSGKETAVDVNLEGWDNINRASVQSVESKYKQACNELGKNTTYPTEYDIDVNDNQMTIELGRYDVTVLRIAYGTNDGSLLYTLPNFISTMTQNTTDFVPVALKAGIGGGVAGVVLIIAAACVIKVLVNRKNKKGDN